MERKKLLAQLPDILRSRLPPQLGSFETILAGRLLKVHYGDPAFHFEVWFHEGKGLVEVAYHGEGSAAANRLLLDRLAARLVDIKESLGPTVELEPWVRSWIRLYRMLPAGSGGVLRAETLAGELAGMIVVVQPIVADLVPVEA